MYYSIRLAISVCLFFSASTFVVAQRIELKVEIAPAQAEPQAAEEPLPAEEDVPAGYEDAPAQKDAAAKKEEKKDASVPAKEELPDGYGEAPAAEEKASDAEAAGGEEMKQLGTLVDLPSGYEEAPAVGEKKPAVEEEKFEAGSVEERFQKEINQKLKNSQVIMEKQIRPYFENLMKVQLSLVKRVCDLPIEKRREIEKVSQLAVSVSIRRVIKSQDGQQNRFAGNAIMVQIGGKPQNVVRPEEVLQKCLGEILKDKIAKEEYAKYEKEIEAFRESCKRTVIEGMVIRLDDKLFLSQEQRNQIYTAIEKAWEDDWLPQMAALQYIQNENYQFLPDRKVFESVLNEKQKKMLKKVNNQGSSFTYLQMGNHNGMPVIDDFLQDP